MNISLLGWLKGGEYRIKVLELLSKRDFLLPSEIADNLDVHRSSISRILADLKEKSLIKSTPNQSRTISYSITKEGIESLKKLQRNGN